jgi:peptidoglycan/LPS O-acetylase OafA/YrhL
VAVIGSFLGMIVLIFAIRSNAKSTFHAAYVVLIISASSAGIAYYTGESAEETVEDVAGVSEASIEPHEEAAAYALGSFIALGVLAAVGFYISVAKENLQPKWGMFMLVLCLVSFGIIARTAWLGGKIRHTEVSGNTVQGREEGEEDD